MAELTEIQRQKNPCSHHDWAVLGGKGTWDCWLSSHLQFSGAEGGFQGLPADLLMAEIKDTQAH